MKETQIKEERDLSQKQRSRSREASLKRRRELAQENAGKEKVKSKKSPVAIWLPIAAAALLATGAAGAGYGYKAMRYKDSFLPNTMVNGMDVSGKSVKEVKDIISSGVDDYVLTLKLRGGKSESIGGKDIGLCTVFDGSLEEIIRQQNPYAWPQYIFKGPSYDIHAMVDYDQAALERKLDSLDCFDNALITPPSDAYLSDYVDGQGYSIIPETEGNALKKEQVAKEAARAVKALEPELDAEALGCYAKPSIRSDNALLTAARDARNRYVNMTVTYTFGSATEVLGGQEIHKWLDVDGENVTLNREKVAGYVKELASRHNTAYKKRAFQTSYGQTVEVSGPYGWRINQQAETEELLAVLEAGESVAREPVYAQTAATYDGPDYGNTYAEVNLTAQHMFFYKDGEKVLESDFVSGSVAKGHTTPPGLFSLTYKQRNAVLKGEGYASPVKFWMPFNGGIGFHDASWRYSFGGSIYKTGGSHGCVNMPYEAARQLFEQVYQGMPVICYNLPGTENGKASSASGREPSGSSQQPAAGQNTAPTPPAQTESEVMPPQTPPAVPEGNQGESLPSEGTQMSGESQGQPSNGQPVEPSQGQPGQPPQSQEIQPEISIQPVGQNGQESQAPSREDGAPSGYGPAFDSPDGGEEVGPGVQ